MLKSTPELLPKHSSDSCFEAESQRGVNGDVTSHLFFTLTRGMVDPCDGLKWVQGNANVHEGLLGLLNAYMQAPEAVQKQVHDLAEYTDISSVYPGDCIFRAIPGTSAKARYPGNEYQRLDAASASAIVASGFLHAETELVALSPGKQVYVHDEFKDAQGSFGTCGRWVDTVRKWRVDIKMEDCLDAMAQLKPLLRVQIKGLQSAFQLNGEIGVCLSLNADTGRWGVRLPTGEEKSLKIENLAAAGSGHTSKVIYVEEKHVFPALLLKLVRCFTMYPIPMDASGRSIGLFSRGCLVNHSCQPNCVAIEQGKDKAIIFQALRPLTVGEHLSFDYVSSLGPGVSKADRMQAITTSFHFVCSCDLCRSSR